MNESLPPVLFGFFCWWFGTGLVFLLDRLLRGRGAAARALIVGLGAASLLAIAASSGVVEPWGAYLGFGASIALWGALELSFLTGWLTGPRTSACPGGCRGWRHFGHAVMALLHHELALVAGALAVAALCWDRPNPTAAWTYAVLWVLRESAKLNLFLGVRNSAAELLPPRLSHLAAFFGKRRVNALLPVSIAAAAAVDAILIRAAVSPAATPLLRSAELMLATLLALAIVEHLVLVLPVRADALWTWATKRGQTRTPQTPPRGSLKTGLRTAPAVVPPVLAHGAPAKPL